MHSSKEQELNVDDDVYNTKTTRIKYLSRYHMENTIKCNERDLFILYFWTGDKILKKRYKKNPLVVAPMQKQYNLAGDFVTNTDNQYVSLKATITMSTLHHNIKFGNMIAAKKSIAPTK